MQMSTYNTETNVSADCKNPRTMYEHTVTTLNIIFYVPDVSIKVENTKQGQFWYVEVNPYIESVSTFMVQLKGESNWAALLTNIVRVVWPSFCCLHLRDSSRGHYI